MGFFSPHKRHANKFNYIPRYYDPAKEERELRRAELRGERMDDEGEYKPGKYIQAKREARELRRMQEQKEQRADKRMKMWTMGVGLILIAIFIYILVPRIGAIFEMATSSSAAAKQLERGLNEYKEVDPYAPIIIVPNDYQEGDELEITDIEFE